MRDFRSLHPQVNIQVTTGIPEDLIKKMEQGEVDIIYILDEPLYNHNWNKLLEQREQIVMVASAGLGQRIGPGTHHLEELLDEPFYLTERHANYRRLLDHKLAALGQCVTPALESSYASFLLHVLEDTEGISYLPWFLVEEKVRQGILTVIDVEELQTTMYGQIFCHKEKWATREMHEFVRLCSLSQRPQSDGL